MPDLPELPATPQAAEELFGPHLALAERYVSHLASTGVEHGLIGPREVPRLWERHVLNCAILTELLEEGAEVVDIGSGAGLPGIALAIRRPDLKLTLVEPLLRRVTWLTRVVTDLNLPRVVVHRGRAQQAAPLLRGDVVTARAVAPLETLIQWALPLLTPRGQLLAMKGRAAEDELSRAAPVLRGAELVAELTELGGGALAEPTRVVQVRRLSPSQCDATPSPRARRSS